MAPNRLLQESSPYLRQHAENPVDWYPWGPEALRVARELNRPIFLSIGYSACHWCHVMEHECFENPQIAAIMNQWFINIKVDREERPDIDQIYMNAVMALTGSGGWPMSVFLTPAMQPFFGGTYWPPEPRWGQPGFPQILDAINDAWQHRQEQILDEAAALTQHVIQAGRPPMSLTRLSLETLRGAERQLLEAFDATHGGFGKAPKFPHPMDLRVLLRCYRRFQNPKALAAVSLTLDRMAAGGIYDHLGGGFARYSTDAVWLVPHFEKMLYDNALLVPVYLEALQITGNRDYERIVRETLDYIAREMTDGEGGFHSTQDADSEGVEGKFFVWSAEEIDQTLGPLEGPRFRAAYDVTTEGNWEHKNILHRPRSLTEIAKQLQVTVEELESSLSQSRKRLFEVRSQRIAPARDEKILTSWNGLMIAACAQAGRVLQEPRYTQLATNAARFVLSTLRSAEGRLWHTCQNGKARLNGYLEDYASLIDGLCELYQTTFDPQNLIDAAGLAERMLMHFRDRDDAGFFDTSDDHEALITRNKNFQDNATPSGNSQAATALLKLGRLCGRIDWQQQGSATLDMMSAILTQAPMAAGQSLLALDAHLGPSYEVVFCSEDELPAPLVEAQRRFLPQALWLKRPSQTADEQLPVLLQPIFAGKQALKGQVTAYICERGACQAPVVAEEIMKALAELS